MSPKNKSYKIIALFLPGFIIIILIVIKIRYSPYSDDYPFIDYWIFQETAKRLPTEIYTWELNGSTWFVYTPAFLLEFFWIGLFSFDDGVVLWWILNILLITIIWGIVLYHQHFTTQEKITFFLFSMVYPMGNEVFVANTEIVLLFCALGAYLLLLKRTKIEKSLEKSENNEVLLVNPKKEPPIFLYDVLAALLFACGCFKPQIIIFLPLLLWKSRYKGLFCAVLAVWILASNYIFLLYPELIVQFIDRIKSGLTLVGSGSYFHTPLLNSLWRNGFSSTRMLIIIFPAITGYAREIFQETTKRHKILWLSGIGFIIFDVIGTVLFFLDF